MEGYLFMIFSKNSIHRTASFVILVPDVEDYHGHSFSADEIIKTAHEFVHNLSDKYININHEEDSVQTDVEFVESFIAPVDIEVEGWTIKQWSWLLGIKFSEEKWAEIESWDIVGVSMEWTWIKNL